MSVGLLIVPNHIPTLPSTSCSYTVQLVFLRFRMRLLLGLSRLRAKRICLWSDIVSWLSTCQSYRYCNNVLEAIVTSMIERLLLLQNVYSDSQRLLSISSSVVAKNSLSANPLAFCSWHPMLDVVDIPKRSDWICNNILLHWWYINWCTDDDIVCYTDGSKLETTGSTGASVYDCTHGNKHTLPLGKYATVFQAELYAILTCVSLLCNCIDRSITICSDSQAALKSISAAKMTSHLVWETA